MKYYDNHMHTDFSGDAHIPMEDMYLQAKENNIAGITFTDHLDLDYYHDPGMFDLDLDASFSSYNNLKKKYNSSGTSSLIDSDGFEVLWGVELGLQEHLAKEHSDLLRRYSFDYVIGSLHQVHKVDPYYPEYYDSRGLVGGVREYFEAILENIEAFREFDALGHLDYVLRYNEEAQKTVTYDDYSDLVKEILSLIIQYDRALEINTGAFKFGLNEPNPSREILKDYRDMGGKLITLGADGHKLEQIAIGYDKLPSIFKECGFDSYVVYKNRKPIEYPV